MSETKIISIEKKKRGRKSKQHIEIINKEYNLTKKEIKNSIQEDIIVKLDIKPEDLENKNIKPYNFTENDFMFIQQQKNQSNKIKKEVDVVVKDEHIKKNGYIQRKLMPIQMEFINKSGNHKLPLTTNVACFNCCHQFITQPIGIPVKKIKDIYHVKGIYCSFACCARAIFEMDEQPWESYSLLMLLHKEMTGVESISKIKLAPPKETLKMFGGTLEIEEYRNNDADNRIYNLLQPPIISLVPTIEDNNLNFEFNNSNSNFNKLKI